MEVLLAIVLFGSAFFLLSLGVLFAKKSLRAGSCGSGLHVKGQELSCGACPSKQAEICPSGDREGYSTIAQIGNPSRKRRFVDSHFSKN
jgi:hypothetical protein